MRLKFIRSLVVMGALAGLGTMVNVAVACTHGGHMRGFGGENGPGPHMMCAHMLMHAPAEALKSKLGLDDKQLKAMEAIRDAFGAKRIQLEATAETANLALEKLWRSDLPTEQAVLSALAAVHTAMGQMHEEHAKTHLKLLAVLNKGQRDKLRADCAAFAKSHPGHGARPPWGGPPAGDNHALHHEAGHAGCCGAFGSPPAGGPAHAEPGACPHCAKGDDCPGCKPGGTCPHCTQPGGCKNCGHAPHQPPAKDPPQTK